MTSDDAPSSVSPVERIIYLHPSLKRGSIVFIQFEDEVKSVLEKAFETSGFRLLNIPLEESEHADLATSAAFRLAATYGKSPVSITRDVQNKIHLDDSNLIGRVEVAGPYINFFVSEKYFSRTVEKIKAEGMDFGRMPARKKVIVEHTSANPNGPLHVGHIRNSIIGDTLARILARSGWNVETQYYVNDMGRQIAVVAWALEHFELDDSVKSDHAIADLYRRANQLLEDDKERWSEVNELLQRVEKGDETVIKRFYSVVGLVMDGIRETLKRLNIDHDRFVNESSFVTSGDVFNIVEGVKETGRVEVDDGALVVDLKDLGIEKSLVLQRRDGTSLYTTRDLAYHKWKAEQCEWMINVLGADHKLISTQLRLVLDLISVKQPDVVIFEFVSLPEGSMSTRRGVFISADELLDEIKKHALEEVGRRRPDESAKFKEEVAEMVGTAAVRYDVIKVSADKSTVFDWRSALDFEKQGAPFIQYAHARACSILRKAEAEKQEHDFELADPALLTNKSERELIKKMAYLPKILQKAGNDLKPHILAVYARELAESFNQFYRDSPVLHAEEDLRRARLMLVDCARTTLAITMETLGIAAPEEM